MDDLRGRILTVLLGHPAVVVPALGGMGALAMAPFVDHSAGFAFVGLVGLAGMVLAATFRATVGRERVTQQVEREVAQERARREDEAETERQAALETLRAQLLGDNDPRTEAILDDLRALCDQLREGRPWMDALDPQARAETERATGQLFDTSVQGLRDSLRIYQSAVRITHAATRERVLGQREALIGELLSSVGTLGDMLAQLQELSVKSHSADEHEQARGRLASHVRAAIQTDQQMRQLAASQSQRTT
jgi:hypothetical protein